MTDDETWFEVKITYELAHVLQRIINVYIRTGRAKRTEMLARVAAAIGDPDAPERTRQ
jgi:hypothetical protein